MKFFFITGAHKSGTSWLANMLKSHEQIAIPKEELWLFGYPSSLINGPLKKHIQEWLQLPTVADEYRGKEEKVINTICRFMVIGLLKQGAGKKIKAVGEKTPLFTAVEYELVYQLFPDAVFIHIYRDCRDVLISHIFHNLRLQDYRWYPSAEHGHRLYDHYINHRDVAELPELVTTKAIAEVGRNWNRVIDSCFRAEALFGDQYCAIRYEDLLLSPDIIMGKILDKLGVDSSGPMVQQMVSRQSFAKVAKGRQPGQEDRTSFFRKGIAGDWQNYLQPNEIAILNEICHENMTKLGYLSKDRESDGS